MKHLSSLTSFSANKLTKRQTKVDGLDWERHVYPKQRNINLCRYMDAYRKLSQVIIGNN